MAQAHYPIVSDSTGKQTNPTAAGAALADTAELGKLTGGAGIYEARVVVGASAAAIFSLEHRNAANDGNATDPTIIYVPAGGSQEVTVRFPIVQDQRVRVKMNADLTGTAAASVSVQRVG